MSGLYNMVFGYNVLAGPLLHVLGRELTDFGRFRDASLWREADGELVIRVYTRNGGGNRDEYMPDFSNDPYYIRDVDDTYDNTYASIFFRIPDRYKGILGACAKDMVFETPEERWQKALENLQKNPEAPDTQALVEKFKPLFAQIDAQLNPPTE